MLAQLRSWWKTVRSQSRLREDLDNELQFHVESYAADLVRTGVSPNEANRRARAELGSHASQREAVRTSVGLRIWDEGRTDLRHGWRLLRKDWLVTVIAVGSLALGIGANTAVFSAAKTILLDPLGVPHPAALRILRWSYRGPRQPVSSIWGGGGPSAESNGDYTSNSFSYPIYEELSRQGQSLADLAAFHHTSRITVKIGNTADARTADLVSGNFFQVLQVATRAGRPLVPADEELAGGVVPVVISDEFWFTRFGRSPEAIGKSISLNDVPATVVGVTPTNFSEAELGGSNPSLYFPLKAAYRVQPDKYGDRLERGDYWWLNLIGRLKDHEPDARTESAFNVTFLQAVRETLPNPYGRDLSQFRLGMGRAMRNNALFEHRLTNSSYVLFASVCLILLLACANVANLLLTRSLTRRAEMNVRAALGASRARIFRQVLIESLLLSVSGGVLGVAVAYGARRLIPSLLSAPELGGFDGRVLVFGAAVSIGTGLLFGLAPAWQAAHGASYGAFGDMRRVTSSRRRMNLTKSLVVAQVALSAVLLIGAGLFSMTLFHLLHAALGFRAERIMLFDLSLPDEQYSGPKRGVAYEQVTEALRALPGVEEVSLSADALISGLSTTENFNPVGQPFLDGRQAWVNVVAPNFFSAFGIPIKAGRAFDRRDTQASEQVVVINQQLADTYFRHQDPIGSQFDSGTRLRIIGICGNTRVSDLRTSPPPSYYVPYTQREAKAVTFTLKTRADQLVTALALQKAVATVDASVSVLNVRTQVEQIAASVKRERLFASLTSGFGVLALLLASIGIYGVMAYSVSRRTNEIGIRMALGAQVAEVLRSVLGEGLLLTVLGLVIGVAGALALTPLVRGLLYGTKPNDPVTLTIAVGVLAVCALAASWLPARRASRVDPMVALRHE